MKMLTLAGPGDAIDHVICTSLVNQQFHPVEAEGILSKNTHMVPLSWNNPWQEPLSMVQKLMEEMEIPFAFADFRQEALDLDTARERLGALNGQFRQFSWSAGSPRIPMRWRISSGLRDFQAIYPRSIIWAMCGSGLAGCSGRHLTPSA